MKNLLEKARRIHTHAAHSNQFYAEFRRQQIRLKPGSPPLKLKHDVDTCWNSSSYMLERLCAVRHPLTLTLIEHPVDAIGLSKQEWVLCEKLIGILRSFDEATKMLSSSEASISLAIPIVTTIIKALDRSREDRGVVTLKRSMIQEMEKIFSALETTTCHAIATLLDPKFKRHFFRDAAAMEEAKVCVIQELTNEVGGLTHDAPAREESQTSSSYFTGIMKGIIDKSHACQ